MSHPPRFRDDDPYLAQVRRICLAFPGAQERISHGHPNFFVKKNFAMFGGLEKGSHDSDRWSQSILVLPEPDEREALLQDERFFTPAYVGPYGWVGLDFRAIGRADAVDWDEVRELVDASYRSTAPKRMIAELSSPAEGA